MTDLWLVFSSQRYLWLRWDCFETN